MTVTIVTSRSHSDDVAVHPVTVICVEAVAEHLFHCIEAVDDRHVVDNFFISELDEMGDAVADSRPPARLVAVSRPSTAAWSPSTSIFLVTKRRPDNKDGISATSSLITTSLPTRRPQKGRMSTGPLMVQTTSSSRKVASASMSRIDRAW